MPALRNPHEEPSLDAALDQLLAGRWPPAAWLRIRDAAELPWRFEALACGLLEGAWRAFTNGAQLAFAVGRFVRSGRQAGAPELMVRFFDASARCCAAAVWTQEDSGQWILCEVLD